jgi:homocysteine S-methyltransferase
VSSLLKEIVGPSDRWLAMCYPNSGERFDAATQLWSGSECSFVNDAPLLREWFDVGGARVIGGCCRVSPSDISRMNEILSKF